MVALLLVLGGAGAVVMFGLLVILSDGGEVSAAIIATAGVLMTFGAVGLGFVWRDARHRRIRREFHRTHPGWPWGADS